MLNTLAGFIRRYALAKRGDTVVCACSGGADSVALLLGLYLLKDSLGIRLEAAHFNHRLRGAESDRDEEFVRQLCSRYDIPLHVGSAPVSPGKKGLEAAAREARYGYFATLEGKLATAHTADDNAETVLMHLVRGTGLKGLGGIAPTRGNIIRPMLSVTRQQVLEFLGEYHQEYVTDSSNETDAFLRNRLRHSVLPLLRQENPRLGQNLSALALRLRQDEALLRQLSAGEPTVDRLRELHPALRSRALEDLLKAGGVAEPESEHILLAEKLVFSNKPSAFADFPGGKRLRRQYDRLTWQALPAPLEPQLLTDGLSLPETDILLLREESPVLEKNRFTVTPQGAITVRARLPGDAMRLSGGTRSLKKIFTDAKIPAALRGRIPVVADEQGVLGVYGIGANLDRIGPGVTVVFQEKE